MPFYQASELAPKATAGEVCPDDYTATVKQAFFRRDYRKHRHDVAVLAVPGAKKAVLWRLEGRFARRDAVFVPKMAMPDPPSAYRGQTPTKPGSSRDAVG
jgi:hypothetical protein